MSNGGIMSYRLAIELNDRIAAIGHAVSDIEYENNFIISWPIPINHFHSSVNSTGLYYGGIDNGVTNYNF